MAGYCHGWKGAEGAVGLVADVIRDQERSRKKQGDPLKIQAEVAGRDRLMKGVRIFERLSNDPRALHQIADVDPQIYDLYLQLERSHLQLQHQYRFQFRFQPQHLCEAQVQAENTRLKGHISPSAKAENGTPPSMNPTITHCTSTTASVGIATLFQAFLLNQDPFKPKSQLRARSATTLNYAHNLNPVPRLDPLNLKQRRWARPQLVHSDNRSPKDKDVTVAGRSEPRQPAEPRRQADHFDQSNYRYHPHSYAYWCQPPSPNPTLDPSHTYDACGPMPMPTSTSSAPKGDSDSASPSIFRSRWLSTGFDNQQRLSGVDMIAPVLVIPRPATSTDANADANGNVESFDYPTTGPGTCATFSGSVSTSISTGENHYPYSTDYTYDFGYDYAQGRGDNNSDEDRSKGDGGRQMAELDKFGMNENGDEDYGDNYDNEEWYLSLGGLLSDLSR
ncbi:hypothetical protein I316_07810 [Kwoniella heveanensis BCC8398]|uniref:Uncharacterized protein n=1 Tax=Kwoniella heveanensis BCC8398 TaxID=1296120 RepID=A0A1B9GHL0_9TREE|nr:hypothetical protein I316_07810 [Kwoniella heveanensis BCC8398]